MVELSDGEYGSVFTKAQCSACGTAVWVQRAHVEDRVILCWPCHG
jgi:formylmethanofuran dehydrogenase subunit E